jgi:fatty acid desaturase
MSSGIGPASPSDETPGGEAADEERQRARRRVEAKRKFQADVVAYVVVNAFLIGVWAVSGADGFWPGWVLAGWGVLLVLQGYDAFFRRPITESDVDAEVARQRAP